MATTTNWIDTAVGLLWSVTLPSPLYLLCAYQPHLHFGFGFMFHQHIVLHLDPYQQTVTQLISRAYKKQVLGKGRKL